MSCDFYFFFFEGLRCYLLAASVRDFTGSESRNKTNHCVPARSSSVVMQTIKMIVSPSER